MAANIPTRLAVCVDRAWFNPDGGAQKSGNLTNIYRLYASIQRGECVEEKYTFWTQNGIPIEVRDIRHRHNEGGYGIELSKVYNMHQNITVNLGEYCDFGETTPIIAEMLTDYFLQHL